MLKLLIIGKKGMLGSSFLKLPDPKFDVLGLDKNQLDITDLRRVNRKICDIGPDIIVNCAAYTDVDGCETNQEKAYNVNGYGARNIAITANKIGAKFVQISSDYVFSGNGTKDLNEKDYVDPINVYGKSKLLGEEMTKKYCEKYFILRTQWLYGINGNNFVKTILRLANEKSSISVVDDQFGCPTYTKDLCSLIFEIVETQKYGTYHISNEDITSWFGFAKYIFKLSNIKTELLACSSETLNRVAKRPKYSALDNLMLRQNGFRKLRSYKDALIEYLNEEIFPNTNWVIE